MLPYSISFLLGVCIIQQLAELPQLNTAVLLLVAAVITVTVFISRIFTATLLSKILKLILIAVLGSFWAIVYAQNYIDRLLTEEAAGIDIIVEGKVRGIPTTKKHIQRFLLDIDEIKVNDIQQKDLFSNTSKPGRIRLSWYYSKSQIRAGETWRLLVRLKPPHGFMNPGGFDYEAWLFQQGLHATGYVRKSHKNQLIKPADRYSIDAVRHSIQQQIKTHLKDSTFRGIITALTVGDRSGISQEQWADLTGTGTNHLMAISGLHIGLAAAFGYWLTRRLVPTALMKYVSAQQVGISVGAFFALIYALLAGFSIPTQRALIMLLCVAGAWLLKRHFRAVDTLSVALFLVLLLDPISVLSAGFWFSFMAVAAIFYFCRDKEFDKKDFSAIKDAAVLNRVTAVVATRLKQWSGLQLVIAFALFPVSLYMFQQTSLVAPVANFILVPYVSFLVVPLILMAIVVFPIYEPIAALILTLASSLLESIWPLLHFLVNLPVSHWVHHVSSLLVVVIAIIGVALLLLNLPWKLSSKSSWSIRISGLFLLMPLVFIRPESPANGSFEFTLLDVGQGLSAVVRTHNHTLLFDSGARFSDSFDSGSAVVLPALRALGTDTLDMMVISHGDKDHIGGAKSILDAFPETQIIGQDIDGLVTGSDIEKASCKKGMKWTWDEVDFEFLHPDDQTYKKRNNHSCVLKVAGSGGSLLLTGDIEKKVEKVLLHNVDGKMEFDAMVVPHHGSNTSSSKQWLEQVNPKLALYSAGYRNRYRLPSKTVINRYRKLQSKQLSTASSGAITLLFEKESGLSIKDRYRNNHSKYWNHKLPQM